MIEELNNKIIIVELAGRNITLSNPNDNFKENLESIGFKKTGEYYSLTLATCLIDQRVALIKKLIKLGAIFSYGKDWSPSELVDYYRSTGLIDYKYYKISWKGKDDFYITLE